MSNFAVFFLAAMIILLIYCVAIYMTAFAARIRINKSTEKYEIINRAAKLNKKVMEQGESLKKYNEIYKYLSSVEPLLNQFMEDDKKLNIVSISVFDPKRLALLNEYRKATKKTKSLLLTYSDLLTDLYKRAHPVKFAFNRIKTKGMWLVAYVYVFFIIMYKSITGTLPAIKGSPEKQLNFQADKRDYERLKDAEPGLCSATL